MEDKDERAYVIKTNNLSTLSDDTIEDNDWGLRLNTQDEEET